MVKPDAWLNSLSWDNYILILDIFVDLKREFDFDPARMRIEPYRRSTLANEFHSIERRLQGLELLKKYRVITEYKSYLQYKNIGGGRGRNEVAGLDVTVSPDIFLAMYQTVWVRYRETQKPKAPVGLPPQEAAIGRICRICDRFRAVSRKLRERRSGKPDFEIDDEYDVQDLFNALLQLDFCDIRAEEWTPSYAGASSRMDFLIKEHKIVVELKKTRKGIDAKTVGEQLMVDIERYSAHPDCDVLVCFVYDPEGRISNPVGVEQDLESRSRERPKVRVLIRPRD